MKNCYVVLLVAFFVSCANSTDGNIIGSWKSINKDKGVELMESTIHMSSTIVFIIRDDGTFEKKVEMWIGDSNIPKVEKGKWVRDGNDVTFTATNTETGEPFIWTQTITKLTNDNLVFNDEFEYTRIK